MKGGKVERKWRVRSEKRAKKRRVCKVTKGFKETENVTSRLILCEDLVATGLKHLQFLQLWQPHTTSHHYMWKNTQGPFFYLMVCFSQAYTHILCPPPHTLIFPQPPTQLRGHNFWRALLSSPVERNVVLWGAEGPMKAGGPQTESWSPLTALTGPRPLCPLHSSRSGYTASGPLSVPWCISNITPHTQTSKALKTSTWRIIHFNSIRSIWQCLKAAVIF